MDILGNKAVGSVVTLNVSGTAKNFIVVHHGLPSSAYDSSCNGTWLLMQSGHSKRVWDSNKNFYAKSDIHSWLNNTFINYFDSTILNKILSVKIPYCTSGSNVSNGANGLTTKAFLLSYTEVGFSNAANDSAPVEGAHIPYFTNSTVRMDSNGASFLRSPHTGSSSTAVVHALNIYGDRMNAQKSYSYSIRPCIILPSDVFVLDDGSVSATEPVTINGSLNVNNSIKTITGGGVNVNGVWHEMTSNGVNVGGTWK